MDQKFKQVVMIAAILLAGCTRAFSSHESGLPAADLQPVLNERRITCLFT